MKRSKSSKGRQEIMMSICSNVLRIREGIASACAKAGRPEQDVSLVAVSKSRTAEEINEVVSAGVLDIGESYAQELMGKIGHINSEARMHFIGRLQSNKARQVVGRAVLLQSVDRLSLAQEISRLAQARDLVQPILLQVGFGEASKGGVSFAQTNELACQIAALPAVKLIGLMSIPPISADISRLISGFERLYHQFVDIMHRKYDNTDIHVLSMGMSSDYREAIACGSTMIRVGTALFG